MTNGDVKQELDLIHFALTDLLELASKDGMEAVNLDAFIKLIEDRFSDLHSHLVSILNTYEVYETLMKDGKDAAQQLADTFSKEVYKFES